jgi:hypothetical protein
MNLNPLLAFVCLTLAGCAGMDATQCGSADWYQVGFRDGLSGMQRMDEAYASQCGKHDANPDRVRYAQGWREGMWEMDQRTAHGGHD